MRLPQSKLQNVKIGLHALQALLIFIAMCIMFALFAQADGKDGGSDGRNKYYIALVFITIPFLIYQVGVPMWSRTQKFSSVYAFLSIDALFTILWLAAFAAVAAWVRAGISQGATDAKISYSAANCTVFAYGTETKCNLGNAATGFGVVVFLLFGCTAAISVMFLLKMRREPAGEDPWLAPSAGDAMGGAYKATPGGLEDGRQSKDPIWDPNYADPNAEPGEDEHVDEHGGEPGADHTLLHSEETDEGRHPGRRWDAPMGPPVDTGYHGAGGSSGNYRAPSALSPSTHGYPTLGGGEYEGDFRAPPRYTFSPAEPIPIPDPGDARRVEGEY